MKRMRSRARPGALTSVAALVRVAASSFVDLATHCNAQDHGTQRGTLEDGFDLFPFDIARIRLPPDPYDCASGDDDV